MTTTTETTTASEFVGTAHGCSYCGGNGWLIEGELDCSLCGGTGVGVLGKSVDELPQRPEAGTAFYAPYALTPDWRSYAFVVKADGSLVDDEGDEAQISDVCRARATRITVPVA